MRVADVDLVATSGTSALHRAAPVAKLLAFACILAVVVVSRDLAVLVGVGLALAAMAACARLPGVLMAILLAYPVFFSAVFALTLYRDPVAGATVVAKAVTGALAALIVVFTTPYPEIFAPIQRVLPEVVADALLLTYRSLFLILEKFSHLLRAVRLRAGLVGAAPLRSARSGTLALGGLLLYSLDLSQRTYDVMRVRGYEGRLRVAERTARWTAMDVAILAGAGAALIGAIAWPMVQGATGLAAWAPAAAGGALFVAALLTRVVTGGGR